MSQHIGSRIVTATGGSIKRVGNYRIHTFPSEIVSDGLVLNIDAGHPSSHNYINVGGLDDVNDISGFGNNGTSDDATYDAIDRGRFTFDSSTSAKIDIDSVPQVTGDYTVEIWFKSTSVVSHKNICDMNFQTGSYNTGPRLEQNNAGTLTWLVGNAGDTAYMGVEAKTNGLASGTVYCCCLVYNSQTRRFTSYMDGSEHEQEDKTFSEDSVSFGDVTLGTGFSAGSRYFDGSIYAFKIYNRSLSAAEVLQNYDALKVRFQTYSNTFTPTCAGSKGKVEVLCVAGGGGGGRQHAGGGGGAGGLVHNTGFSLTNNVGVALTVGQGGLAGVQGGQAMGNGGNSTFSTITATGGGKGGEENSPRNGTAGGSGGGGSGYATATTGGAGTSGQGNAGGGGGTPSSDNTYGQGGGGGGAGAAGGDGPEGTNNSPGNGGAGLAYDISGELKFYAGGGGGGSWDTSTGLRNLGGLGGSGVGGKGGCGATNHGFRGQNGVPNTGSGGGGSAGSAGPRDGGNGSNGVVIVRYPAEDYNVEVLVVGGGGGGGSGSQYAYSGGGGGAGGFIYRSKLAVSSGLKVPVSIGRGGAKGSGYDPAPFGNTGTSGSNSRFGDLIAIGGGAGGGGLTYDGVSGGSGGGGGGRASNGGVGTTGQGFAGGNSSDHGDTTTYGAGGGGASSAGGNGSNTTTAPGGEGKANSITGSSVTYSVGGAGGHDSGTGSSTPVTNSGSGGQGGVGGGGDGVNGADGIVVVAYKGPQRGTGGTIDTTSRPGYTLHKFTSFGNDTYMP